VIRQSVATLAAALVTLTPAAAWAAVPAGFTDALVTAVPAPTDVAFTPDGRILVTSQSGVLRVYDQAGTLLGTALTLSSTQICSNSERGLLGVTVDPAFATNGFVYLFYTHRKPGGDCGMASPITSLTTVNRVSRFTMTGNAAALSSEVVLIDEMPSPAGNHNAGDLGFGKDGYLYVSIGDGGCDWNGGGCGGSNDAARDQHVLTGKILRVAVNANGSTSIPPSNPFQGPDSDRCALSGRTAAGRKCQETFAWGLRNPFRFAFDPNAPGTRLFIDDVGQGAREEIDLGQAGADYGWNCREGTRVNSTTGACSPTPPGMVDPIFDYGRGSLGSTSGCASITGGAFVPSGVWPAAYDGAYLFADYVCGWIFQLSGMAPLAAADFATNLGGSSATSLAFGPYQSTRALYYTTYGGGGQLRRISYALPGNNAPTAVAFGSPLTGGPPLIVTFSAAGSSDPDAGDTLTYFWNFGDGGPEAVTASLTVQHTYVAAGSYTATLRARDDHFSFSAPATVVVQPGNTPPVPQILTPAPGATFGVGQTLTLSGSAMDAQDGPLPANRRSWSVILHHGGHTHPFLGPVNGDGISFTAPAPEDLAAAAISYLEVQLTATDFGGASATVTRDVQPRKVDITFATEPPGLAVDVQGATLTGPQTVTSWDAYVLDVTAPSFQANGGQTWVFSSWADGGSSSRSIVTPSAAATYTARYQLSVDGGPTDFFTLNPCRVLDTRGALGPLGGPALAAGQTRTFPLHGVCGIPATARALAVNLTVVAPTAAGHVRMYAADELAPSTAVTSFRAGQTRGSQAFVRLSSTGEIAVFAGMSSGTAHVVLDVSGYFE
jgi:glucose/arabinose dehydrogenase/PKD repeat protein